MKPSKLLMLFCILSVTSGAIVYRLVQLQFKKIGVVDAVNLFDNYNMKKDLEARAKLKLQRFSKQVDSIGNLLQIARATKDTENIKKLTYSYNYVKISLENDYKESNHDINEQVWKRLNPIIEEYGKKQQLHLIIGANGMGSVLYNDEYYDLTSDLIKYVNRKYENGN